MRGTHPQLVIAEKRARWACWLSGFGLAFYIIIMLIMHSSAVKPEPVRYFLQLLHDTAVRFMGGPLETLAGWHAEFFLVRVLTLLLQIAIVAGFLVSLYFLCYYHMECQHLIHPEKLRGTGLALDEASVSSACAELELLQQSCPAEDVFAGEQYVRVQMMATTDARRRDYIIRWDRRNMHIIQAPPYQYLTLGLHKGVPMILCLEKTGSDTDPVYIEKPVALPAHQPLVIYRGDQKVTRYAITWLGGR